MKNVFLYGDSNTYGFDPAGDIFYPRYAPDKIWVNIVNKKLVGKVHIMDDGMNGRQIPSSDMEYDVFREKLRKLPEFDVFAVMLGTNDYLNMMEPDERIVAEKMGAFLTNVKFIMQDIGINARILLIAPPQIKIIEDPRYDTTDGNFAKEYKKLSEELNCEFIDAGACPLAFDGVHLSEEGHKMLAELINNGFRLII